jgi:hypothetical protein
VTAVNTGPAAMTVTELIAKARTRRNDRFMDSS